MQSAERGRVPSAGLNRMHSRLLRGVCSQQSMTRECRQQSMTRECRPPHAAVMLMERQGTFFTGQQGVQFAGRGRCLTIGCKMAVLLKSAVGGCCLACAELGAERRSVGCCRAAAGFCPHGAAAQGETR